MRRPDYLPLCSIAAWDPTCGAGAGADLRVFSAHGAHGSAILTALTAQTREAFGPLTPTRADGIRAQIQALAEPPRAWKVGLLPDAAAVEAVADGLADVQAPVVCDPVLAATAPGWSLPSEAVDRLRAALVPRATLLTPNAAEARRLAGLAGDAPIEDAVAALLDAGAKAVLVTGGDEGDDARDRLFRPGEDERAWALPRVDGGPFHGTGCALSSAVAVRLAQGHDTAAAIEQAKQYVHALLALASESASWLLPHLAVRPT